MAPSTDTRRRSRSRWCTSRKVSANIRVQMLYFFRKKPRWLMCETRLHHDRAGYRLVVRADGEEQVKDFVDLPALLLREHALQQTWRMTGWRDDEVRARPNPSSAVNRGAGCAPDRPAFARRPANRCASLRRRSALTRGRGRQEN